MKRRLLAVLLAVAMLATSFVALPVFAAVESENVGTLEIPTGKDTQVSFSKGYTGTVTVSFDLTMGEGTQGTDLYLAPSGADRMSAKPYLQITQEGGV